MKHRIPLTGGPGTYYPANQASGIAVSNGDVYVSGTVLSNSTGHYFAAYWKNGVLIPVGDSVNDNTYASGIALSGSDVLVCGYDGNKIILWRNAVATVLSNDQQETAQGNASIAVSGSDVYVAGTVTYVNQQYTSAVYWKNGSAIFLTDGSSNAEANGIAADNVDVFVAGSRINDHNYSSAAFWKDNNPGALPDSAATSVARSICVY